MSTAFLKNCQKFRALLKEGGLMLPGAFNGQVGRLVAMNGRKGIIRLPGLLHFGCSCLGIARSP
jgi:hypothetical protein